MTKKKDFIDLVTRSSDETIIDWCCQNTNDLIEMRFINENTFLHILIEKKKYKVVTELLDRKEFRDLAQQSNSREITLVHTLAIAEKQYKDIDDEKCDEYVLMSKILRLFPELCNAQTKFGDTALHRVMRRLEAKLDCKWALKCLIANKIDINISNQDGLLAVDYLPKYLEKEWGSVFARTPLEKMRYDLERIISQKKSDDIYSQIEELYKQDPLLVLNTRFDKQETVLHFLIRKKRGKVVERLLQMSDFKKLALQRNRQGLDIIHCIIARKGDDTLLLERILLILQDSIILLKANSEGETPLMFAFKLQKLAALECLIRVSENIRQDFIINGTDEKLISSLLEAYKGNIDSRGNTFLHWLVARRTDTSTLVKEFIATYPSLVHHKNADGDTALQSAIRYARHWEKENTNQLGSRIAPNFRWAVNCLQAHPAGKKKDSQIPEELMEIKTSSVMQSKPLSPAFLKRFKHWEKKSSRNLARLDSDSSSNSSNYSPRGSTSSSSTKDSSKLSAYSDASSRSLVSILETPRSQKDWDEKSYKDCNEKSYEVIGDPADENEKLQKAKSLLQELKSNYKERDSFEEVIEKIALAGILFDWAKLPEFKTWLFSLEDGREVIHQILKQIKQKYSMQCANAEQENNKALKDISLLLHAHGFMSNSSMHPKKLPGDYHLSLMSNEDEKLESDTVYVKVINEKIAYTMASYNEGTPENKSNDEKALDKKEKLHYVVTKLAAPSPFIVEDIPLHQMLAADPNHLKIDLLRRLIWEVSNITNKYIVCCKIIDSSSPDSKQIEKKITVDIVQPDGEWCRNVITLDAPTIFTKKDPSLFSRNTLFHVKPALLLELKKIITDPKAEFEWEVIDENGSYSFPSYYQFIYDAAMGICAKFPLVKILNKINRFYEPEDKGAPAFDDKQKLAINYFIFCLINFNYTLGFGWGSEENEAFFQFLKLNNTLSNQSGKKLNQYLKDIHQRNQELRRGLLLKNLHHFEEWFNDRTFKKSSFEGLIELALSKQGKKRHKLIKEIALELRMISIGFYNDLKLHQLCLDLLKESDRERAAVIVNYTTMYTALQQYLVTKILTRQPKEIPNVLRFVMELTCALCPANGNGYPDLNFVVSIFSAMEARPIARLDKFFAKLSSGEMALRDELGLILGCSKNNLYLSEYINAYPMSIPNYDKIYKQFLNVDAVDTSTIDSFMVLAELLMRMQTIQRLFAGTVSYQKTDVVEFLMAYKPSQESILDEMSNNLEPRTTLTFKELATELLKIQTYIHRNKTIYSGIIPTSSKHENREEYSPNQFLKELFTWLEEKWHNLAPNKKQQIVAADLLWRILKSIRKHFNVVDIVNGENFINKRHALYKHQVIRLMPLAFSAISGCDLHVMSELPESFAPYKGSYLFIKNDDTQELYYIDPYGVIQKVKINDFTLFEKKINEITLKVADKLYLSKNQIKEIIKLDGVASGDLYVMSELPKSFAPYKGSYLFIKNDDTQELYYIDPNGENKKLEIKNLNLLKEKINVADKLYLSKKQIKEIITANGGHTPVFRIKPKKKVKNNKQSTTQKSLEDIPPTIGQKPQQEIRQEGAEESPRSETSSSASDSSPRKPKDQQMRYFRDNSKGLWEDFGHLKKSTQPNSSPEKNSLPVSSPEKNNLSVENFVYVKKSRQPTSEKKEKSSNRRHRFHTMQNTTHLKKSTKDIAKEEAGWDLSGSKNK